MSNQPNIIYASDLYSDTTDTVKETTNTVSAGYMFVRKIIKLILMVVAFIIFTVIIQMNVKIYSKNCQRDSIYQKIKCMAKNILFVLVTLGTPIFMIQLLNSHRY